MALVTLLAVVAYGWQSEGERGLRDGRIVGLEAQISERIALEIALRSEVETWKAYVVSLKEVMIRSGLTPPPPPGGASHRR